MDEDAIFQRSACVRVVGYVLAYPISFSHRRPRRALLRSNARKKFSKEASQPSPVPPYATRHQDFTLLFPVTLILPSTLGATAFVQLTSNSPSPNSLPQAGVPFNPANLHHFLMTFLAILS